MKSSIDSLIHSCPQCPLPVRAMPCHEHTSTNTCPRRIAAPSLVAHPTDTMQCGRVAPCSTSSRLSYPFTFPVARSRLLPSIAVGPSSSHRPPAPVVSQDEDVRRRSRVASTGTAAASSCQAPADSEGVLSVFWVCQTAFLVLGSVIAWSYLSAGLSGVSKVASIAAQSVASPTQTGE